MSRERAREMESNQITRGFILVKISRIGTEVSVTAVDATSPRTAMPKLPLFLDPLFICPQCVSASTANGLPQLHESTALHRRTLTHTRARAHSRAPRVILSHAISLKRHPPINPQATTAQRCWYRTAHHIAPTAQYCWYRTAHHISPTAQYCRYRTAYHIAPTARDC